MLLIVYRRGAVSRRAGLDPPFPASGPRSSSSNPMPPTIRHRSCSVSPGLLFAQSLHGFSQ